MEGLDAEDLLIGRELMIIVSRYSAVGSGILRGGGRKPGPMFQPK